jgi:IS30 family transposase
MPDKTEKKHKHLTLDEREEIQGCLDHGMTFKAIGQRIGKDQTTVSKEVKRHLVTQPLEHRTFDSQGNPLPPEPCPRHLKAPFCCNPCEKKHRLCVFQKRFYHAKPAQKAYESLLVECREGTPLNRESFYEMDAVIAKQMKKGQHLYHISQTQNLGASTASVYRYLHKGYLSAGKMDFPRVVKFKPRQPRQREYIPKSAKLGRTYEDFLAHVAENSLNAWVEMDTVIGRVGGKVILTLDFTFCNFQAGLLMDNKSSLEAAHKIRLLKNSLALAGLRFGDLFPVILTDNGGEFANVDAFERDAAWQKETLLFFCDPYRSSQKPYCEKNHTMFRDIVPSGSSFDDFSQDTVNLIFSHVNSVKRKSLGGKSPFEVFAFLFGRDAAATLGIRPILPADVIQSPKLLRK